MSLLKHENRNKTGLSGVFKRLYLAAVLLFLYAPILTLIVFSFNASKSRARWDGFTCDWYIQLSQDSDIINALYVTLAVAVLSALIATVIGTLGAIGIHSMGKFGKTLWMNVANLNMLTPDIVIGVSMMIMFIFFKLELGFFTMLLAHVTFNIPYVVLAVLPKLRQLNPNLGEAAMDLGATPWQAFWKVLMPELRPGILNGMLIAFTMSIDDFVISYFTAGSEVSTLAMQIYAMTRKRISPEVNALSTILFVVVLTLLVIVNVRQVRQEQLNEKRARILRKGGN